MEAIKSIFERIAPDKIIVLGIGTTIWNWLVNSDLGIMVANVTGIMILFLVIRQVVMAVKTDLATFRNDSDKKKIKSEGESLHDINELNNLIK